MKNYGRFGQRYQMIKIQMISLKKKKISKIKEKGASSTAIHGDKEEASSIIKLGDLAKLVSQIQPRFKDLDSPKDDTVIIIDKSDEVEPNAKTEDTSVPRSSSHKSSQIQELTNQWELLKEFLSLPAKVELAQAKLKTLDAFPSLLLNVTKALNKFTEVLESTSTKTGD
nr:hypothetical protein [Tanacetum cinerariifolium]